MSEITLITGGARSGKSTFAEQLAQTDGGRVCYIATAIAFDEGMQERIKLHRAQRPAIWETVEAYDGLGEIIRQRQGLQELYLLDCVTLMVTNLMFRDMPDYDTLLKDQVDTIEAQIMAQVDDLVLALRETDSRMLLVTNEVGMGIVPENAIARIYRDIAGRVNQRLGHAADRVYLVVCGQVLQIKGQGTAGALR